MTFCGGILSKGYPDNCYVEGVEVGGPELFGEEPGPGYWQTLQTWYQESKGRCYRTCNRRATILRQTGGIGMKRGSRRAVPPVPMGAFWMV